MKYRFRNLSVIFAFVLSLPLMADPLGQTAHYELDHDSERTSSMIEDGTVDTAVTQYDAGAVGGPAYEVAVNFDLQIFLEGEKKGTQSTWLGSEYFTPDFLAKLREEGQYSGPDFKATHQGYEDATTLDGHSYPHCDKVLFYDLKQNGREDEIQDLKILAHLFPGIPVLGAVKLDLTGVYNGISVKAGGDYQASEE